MSKPKKRKFTIEPNSLSEAEESSTRNVLRRMRNPFGAPTESEPATKIEPPAEIAAPLEIAPAPKIAAPPKTAQPPQRTAGAPKITGGSESEGATGYTSINNFILDKVLRTLKPLEQVTLLRLLRLSHGFGKTFCKVSVPALASACNAGQTQIRIALRALETAGHIERGETDYANPNQSERGAVYHIFLAMPLRSNTAPPKSAGATKSEPIKDKDLKESNIKGRKGLEVGKLAEPTEIIPLDEEGRERILADYQKLVASGELETVKANEKFFTPEDWKYLMERIGK